MREPPGVDATQKELDAYKDWLMLVHEQASPASGNAVRTSGAGLLEMHARLLLQRLAAFFHDEEMIMLWVLAAKTVMEFARRAGSEGALGRGGSIELLEMAEMAREAGIEALEHTLTAGANTTTSSTANTDGSNGNSGAVAKGEESGGGQHAVLTNAAAKALQILAARSDALALHLVGQLGVWPIEAATVLGSIQLTDPRPLKLLLDYANAKITAVRGAAESTAAARRAERGRSTALSVLRGLVITDHAQAAMCLQFVPVSGAAGSLLCGALMAYLQASRSHDPRWLLPEELHRAMLMLQRAHPRSLDIALLLRYVRLGGLLKYSPQLSVFQ